MKAHYKKRNFLLTFSVVFVCIAALQAFCHFPTAPMPEKRRPVAQTDITDEEEDEEISPQEQEEIEDMGEDDTPVADISDAESLSVDSQTAETLLRTASVDTLQKPQTEPRHRPLREGSRVWSYVDCFPDIQGVQLPCAQRNGIVPPQNRNEIETLVRKHKLVDITSSPFYAVDNLTHSLPYLVPRAQHLLNTIAINFLDSLQCKGLEPHLLVISSVLRTAEDVSNLQRGNRNATTNSCHSYGTTVDIAYSRFIPLAGNYPYSEVKPVRWNEDLKFVLAEVLYDLRVRGHCYVKYERKQPCFHLTVR